MTNLTPVRGGRAHHRTRVERMRLEWRIFCEDGLVRYVLALRAYRRLNRALERTRLDDAWWGS